MAAAETIKEFLVSVGFDVDEEGLRSYAGKVANFAKGIGLAVAAAAGSFTLLKAAVKETANRFDELGDRADRIGIASSELERLSYIAEHNASSTEALQSSFERFSTKIGEAVSGIGIGRAAKVFESLGISLKDSQGNVRDSTDLFNELGEKITDLDRAQQLNIMSKLGLDSSLLQMMTTDTRALGEEFDDLYQRGAFSIDKLADTSTDFNNAVHRMGYTFDVFKWSLVDSIIEPLSDSADSITKTFRDMMGGLLKVLRPFFKFFGNIFAGVLKVMRRFFQGVQWAVGGVYDSFSFLFGAMPTWVKVLGGLVIGIKALFALLAASPVGFVIALALAIGALIDDFLVWKNAGQSLIDWSAWSPAIESATEAIQNIIQMFRDLFSAVYAVIGAIVSLLQGDTDGFFEGMRVAIDSVIGAFENLFGWITKTRDFLGNTLGGVASWAKEGLNGIGIHAFDDWLPAGNSNILAPDRTQQNNQNVSVTNNITIQGSQSPEATSAAVVKAEQRAYKDASRNGRAVAR